jgi:hypothetical protein
MPQHVWMNRKRELSGYAWIIRRNQAVVTGVPASVTDTYGDCLLLLPVSILMPHGDGDRNGAWRRLGGTGVGKTLDGRNATILLKPGRLPSIGDHLRDELDQLAKVLQQAPIFQG